MQFSQLSSWLEKLEHTNSRLEMMYQLADLYKLFQKDEITVASYLIQGSLVPPYLSLEFQLSVKMVLRALAQVHSEYAQNSDENIGLFGEIDISFSLDFVTKKYKDFGDIGIVASEIIINWRKNKISVYPKIESESLSVIEVYKRLVEIAREGGSGSQDRKLQKLVQLFKFSDPFSAKFISRIVVGKLRLGFSAMTILDALSWAVMNSKEHRKILENAYQKRADVGELSQVYLQLAREITENLQPFSHEEFSQQLEKKLEERYKVAVGIPVVPALCQRLNTAPEIIKKMGTVIAEPKYDGLRIQIHYAKDGFSDGSKMRAFTRNLEEVTHMFPELLEVTSRLKTDSCILDAEAIGYDTVSDKLLPFQETITRKRKHDVGEASEKVPIRFYVFDVLYSGSRGLLEEKLQKRKDLLEQLFDDNRTIKSTEYIVTSDPEKLHVFHERQLHDGLEGAVIKQIDSQYQSGRKGFSWVKIKEREGSSGKLKDTLDLVVMGYYFGRGKRSKFGIGAFLVGVLDDKQNVKTIAKIGTGLSDEQFRELKNRADKLTTQTQPNEYEVEKALVPDVWMSPELVVEIAADEITKSPNHSAGVALRFPRLVAFRDDKNWTDATTFNELQNF